MNKRTLEQKKTMKDSPQKKKLKKTATYYDITDGLKAPESVMDLVNQQSFIIRYLLEEESFFKQEYFKKHKVIAPTLLGRAEIEQINAAQIRTSSIPELEQVIDEEE